MSHLLRAVLVGSAAACLTCPGLMAQREGGPGGHSTVVLITWPDGSVLRADPPDTAVARALLPSFERARRDIEAFFGSPYSEPMTVTLVPDRAAFSATLNAAWGVGETACWMVATGVADFLVMLSPRVWNEEACEHDPADSQHVDDIIAHEMVHVYHGQRHPSRDFDVEGAEDMGWFLEGLATYVAGQLDRARLATAEEALAGGALPTRLRDAWSGRFRYGVSGSLVRFIDERFGRRTLIGLLPLTGNGPLLDALGLTEDRFLAAWGEWLARR